MNFYDEIFNKIHKYNYLGIGSIQWDSEKIEGSLFYIQTTHGIVKKGTPFFYNPQLEALFINKYGITLEPLSNIKYLDERIKAIQELVQDKTLRILKTNIIGYNDELIKPFVNCEEIHLPVISHFNKIDIENLFAIPETLTNYIKNIDEKIQLNKSINIQSNDLNSINKFTDIYLANQIANGKTGVIISDDIPNIHYSKYFLKIFDEPISFLKLIELGDIPKLESNKLLKINNTHTVNLFKKYNFYEKYNNYVLHKESIKDIDIKSIENAERITSEAISYLTNNMQIYTGNKKFQDVKLSDFFMNIEWNALKQSFNNLERLISLLKQIDSNGNNLLYVSDINRLANLKDIFINPFYDKFALDIINNNDNLEEIKELAHKGMECVDIKKNNVDIPAKVWFINAQEIKTKIMRSKTGFFISKEEKEWQKNLYLDMGFTNPIEFNHADIHQRLNIVIKYQNIAKNIKQKEFIIDKYIHLLWNGIDKTEWPLIINVIKLLQENNVLMKIKEIPSELWNHLKRLDKEVLKSFFNDLNNYLFNLKILEELIPGIGKYTVFDMVTHIEKILSQESIVVSKKKLDLFIDKLSINKLNYLLQYPEHRWLDIIYYFNSYLDYKETICTIKNSIVDINYDKLISVIEQNIKAYSDYIKRSYVGSNDLNYFKPAFLDICDEDASIVYKTHGDILDKLYPVTIVKPEFLGLLHRKYDFVIVMNADKLNKNELYSKISKISENQIYIGHYNYKNTLFDNTNEVIDISSINNLMDYKQKDKTDALLEKLLGMQMIYKSLYQNKDSFIIVPNNDVLFDQIYVFKELKDKGMFYKNMPVEALMNY